jgi:hypothetical protein
LRRFNRANGPEYLEKGDILNRRGVLCLPILAALAACQEAGGSLGDSGALVRAPNVPVTILGVDGLPDAVNAPMLDALSAAATDRGLALVEAQDKPRFQIKGYFSAAPGESGTVISYVWDVLDTSSDLSERVEGSATTPRRAEDPWGVLDASTQKVLAGRSMNDLAGLIARASSSG